ncbi:MAG: hypothetical protein ACOH10_00045 [Rhodoglobus sp.]
MRFSLSDLSIGFMKVLRNRNTTPSRPDYAARSVLLLVPILCGAAVLRFDIHIQAPATLLTGIAILAGGFLTAFTHISTLRLRLTERQDNQAESEIDDRDLIDEIATLLLVAAFFSVATAATLVVAMNWIEEDFLYQGAAALVAGLGAEVVALFLLTIPRLYNAYLQINKVRPALNGANRSKRESQL